jgi:hypothetical protein
MYECGAGNYWYYHKGSFPADAPLHYSQLISTAKTKIEIWDPYINLSSTKDDLQIFDNIPSSVTLKILTSKKLSGPDIHYLNSIHLSLKGRIPPSKNLRFGMRVLDMNDPATKNGWNIHDRFLIIDDTDVFLVGSSIGWHLTAYGSTGIYRVDSHETCDFIRSIFTEYWRQASSNEIPIQFLHP